MDGTVAHCLMWQKDMVSLIIAETNLAFTLGNTVHGNSRALFLHAS